MDLEIKSVSKHYGNKCALDNINVVFQQGVTGLLGPNGAGKSTLMRLMATIDRPSSGQILFKGKNIEKKPNTIRSVLGYLPQDFGVYPNLTATEFLEYMAALKGLPTNSAKRIIKELIEILHLTDAKKRKLGGFSGGMRQRVGIAQALLNNPQILIVDEPTVGLDPEERITFRNLIASIAMNRIVILSTHIVTDIEAIAPKITILAHGKLLSKGTPEVLLAKVKGKVWNCIVTSQKLLELQQNFTVSNSMQRSDGIFARVISCKQPVLGATQVQPNLEDAYLFETSHK